jgi:phage shock protein C
MRVSKRLYRSRADTVLGGVAAGLATYLDADPALVRIAWAILVVITGGLALLVYIVAWVVVPEEPEADAAPAVEPQTDPVTGEVVTPVVSAPAPVTSSGSAGGTAGAILGIGLVLVGVWFLVRELLPDFDWGLIWPLVLVGIGALILVGAMRRREG